MTRLFHAPVAAFLAMMVGASPSFADGGAPVPTGGEIIINTDTGAIQFLVNGASLPATVTREGDVMVYTFHGDLVIPDDTVVKGTGQLGAAFRATNNAFIGKNVKFDFSATGATAGIGGGAGGGASPAGAGGDAEPEYINPGSAPGGQGNQIVCVAGICLVENRSARPGSSISPGVGRGFNTIFLGDTDGQQGPTGGAGAPGLGGGAGGEGGEGGVGPAQFRELVTFGHPSDPAFIYNIFNEIKGLTPGGGAAAPDRGHNGGQGQDALPFVFDWMHGADGVRGEDGSAGAGGSNNGTGLALSVAAAAARAEAAVAAPAATAASLALPAAAAAAWPTMALSGHSMAATAALASREPMAVRAPTGSMAALAGPAAVAAVRSRFPPWAASSSATARS